MHEYVVLLNTTMNAGISFVSPLIRKWCNELDDKSEDELVGWLVVMVVWASPIK